MESSTTEKRLRSTNFSALESEVLCSLVDKYKQTVECKQSDAVTWKEKEDTWKQIESEFNARAPGGAYRSVKTLKTKYDALKRTTRKKSAAIRAELYRTGNFKTTAPPLDMVEEKIKEMVLLSVDGMESTYDSDVLSSEPSMLTVPSEFRDESVLFEIPVATEEVGGSVIIEELQVVSSPLPISSPSVNTQLTTPQTYKNVTWDPSTRKNLKKRKHPLLNVAADTKSGSKIADIEDAKLHLLQLQTTLVENEIRMKDKEEKSQDIQHEWIEKKLKLEVQILEFDLAKRMQNL